MRELDRRLAPPADDPGRLVEAMHYAATGPGKRLRPAIVIAAADACGGTRAQALPAAAALEMLHAYTLVHDDLPAMDDDDERRGRPTVHIAFGEAIAILAGDGLLTQAFGTLAELGPRAADAVARARASAPAAPSCSRGQAIDLDGARRRTTARRRSSDMHAAKTGALFAAAGELGAIAAGAPPRRAPRSAATASRSASRSSTPTIATMPSSSSTPRPPRAGCASSVRPSARGIAPLGARGALLDAIAAWIAVARVKAR